jgi:hypothetical protein
VSSLHTEENLDNTTALFPNLLYNFLAHETGLGRVTAKLTTDLMKLCGLNNSKLSDFYN